MAIVRDVLLVLDTYTVPFSVIALPFYEQVRFHSPAIASHACMGSTEANMLKVVFFVCVHVCVGSLRLGLNWGMCVPSQGSSTQTEFQEENGRL